MLTSGREETTLKIIPFKIMVQQDYIFSFLSQVAQIVKREMEAAVKLYVKLRAKVKVGPSWGNLQELDI